jgi:hypothetical protein
MSRGGIVDIPPSFFAEWKPPRLRRWPQRGFGVSALAPGAGVGAAIPAGLGAAAASGNSNPHDRRERRHDVRRRLHRAVRTAWPKPRAASAEAIAERLRDAPPLGARPQASVTRRFSRQER